MPFHIPKKILACSVRLTVSKKDDTCHIYFSVALSSPDNVIINSLALMNAKVTSIRKTESIQHVKVL